MEIQIPNDLTEIFDLLKQQNILKLILEEDGEKPLPMSCQASLRYSSVNIISMKTSGPVKDNQASYL